MILASRPLNPAKFPLRELNRGVLRTPRPPEPYPDRHYHPRHYHKPGRCPGRKRKNALETVLTAGEKEQYRSGVVEIEMPSPQSVESLLLCSV